MTLDQFQELRLWHLHHGNRPVEGVVWNGVVTLWMMAWVGTPAALLLGWDEVVVAGLALLFLPSAYVAVRRQLHRRGLLRCEWIGALR